MYHCNTLSLIIAKSIRAIEDNLLIWLVILWIRSIILRKCSYICPVKVKVAQSCLTLCNPMDLVHGILQARMLEWVAFPFSRGSSQPRSLTLQADSLPAEPQGKPKNTGVGSLSPLQWIFPTQESNEGLLHRRWILYQLSYEGSHICLGGV